MNTKYWKILKKMQLMKYRREWSLLFESEQIWKWTGHVGWQPPTQFFTLNPIRIFCPKIVVTQKLFIESKLLIVLLPLILYSLLNFIRILKCLNHSLWRLMEAGLVDHWKKVYIPSIGQCDLNTYQNSQKKTKPIRLIELSSAFFVLGIGLGLSILAFLMERIIHFGGKIRAERNIVTI